MSPPKCVAFKDLPIGAGFVPAYPERGTPLLPHFKKSPDSYVTRAEIRTVDSVNMRVVRYYTPPTLPLPAEDVAARRDEDGRIAVVVSLPLTDLIGDDIESLNDRVDEMILGDQPACLSGLSYRVVGHVEGGDMAASWFDGEVLIEVVAEVVPYDAEDEGDDEDDYHGG